LFSVNIFVTEGAFAILIGGQAALTSFGFPTEEMVFAGYVPSVMLGYAIMGIIGLRYLVKFAPVLIMQAIGKIVWFLAIIIPRSAAGPLSSFTVMLSAMFIPLILGDLIIVPWKYLFAK